MFTIEDNYMTVVKGDTAIFNLEIENYKLEYGDIVYFTVKESIDDKEPPVIRKVVNEFEDGIAKFSLTSDDTNIETGKYYYDIQVSLLDGRVDTVITPSRFKVIGGVTSE